MTKGKSTNEPEDKKEPHELNSRKQSQELAEEHTISSRR